MPETPKSRRTTLSISEKYQIIQDRADGKPLKDLAAQYNISLSAISMLMKPSTKAKIVEAVQRGECSTSVKRMRHPSQNDVDEKLLEWFTNAEGQLENLSGDVLLIKANEISRELGHDVAITMSWICRWKARHSITFKVLQGEGGAVTPDMIHEWSTTTLPRILDRYELEAIYNADEAGLAWRQQTEGTHTFKSTVRKGRKVSKERITMLVAANSDGTDKLPLLIIGKSARPRCFKGVKSLPLPYSSNKSAWMVSTEFNAYISKLDQKMRAQGRKIALIIDNVGTHKLTHVVLTNIEVFYLPPNATSVVQPMDNGVIRSLKARYRKRLARHRLRAFDAGRDHKLTLLDALHMLRSSWDEMSAELIRNCFAAVGFCEEQTLVDETDATWWQELEAAALVGEASLDEYLSIDDDLPTHGMELLEPFNDDADVDLDDDDDDDPAPLGSQLSDAQAADMLTQLRNYMSTKDDSERYIVALSSALDFVDEARIKAKKQTKITDFFRK